MMSLTEKGRVVCTDIYDADGNLTRCEAYTRDEKFVLQAIWDERDEQTSANREEFRKWFYRHLEQSGYAVD
jgi:radical SAM protein with 4Fe4S-binding SPASM domain